MIKERTANTVLATVARQEAGGRNKLSSFPLFSITAKAQHLSLEAPPLANTPTLPASISKHSNNRK